MTQALFTSGLAASRGIVLVCILGPRSLVRAMEITFSLLNWLSLKGHLLLSSDREGLLFPFWVPGEAHLRTFTFPLLNIECIPRENDATTIGLDSR